MLRQFGAEPKILPLVKDDSAEISQTLNNLNGVDLLITIGGASVGDYDLTKKVLGRLGYNQKFYKISMRPGKPVFGGLLDKLPVIGLPGNPVSAMVCCQVLIKPMINKMLGLSFKQPKYQKAILSLPIEKNGIRTHFMRSYITKHKNGYYVRPVSKQDSSLLTKLNQSNCLIVRPPRQSKQNKGDIVNTLSIF
tara:strand:- start:33 stop:611 length:579 start_codon:yes stop_codon:yes gene_type:complete